MTSPSVRPLVLLVEDDQDTREMYAMYLEHSGFAVLTAAQADTAFDLAVARQPQMVVTDYQLMGPGTGADLCDRLHADSRTAAIPTLLVTGSARQQDAGAAGRAGCAMVRLKPYLPDALVDDVREALARAHGQTVSG